MSARQKVFFENKNVVLRSIYVGKVAQIGFVSPGESNRRIRLEWGTKKVNSLGQAVSITFSVSLTEKKSVKKFFLHFIVVVVAVVKTTAKERKKYTILLRVSGIWTTLTCFGCLIRFETTFTTLQLPQKILFASNVFKSDSKIIIASFNEIKSKSLPNSKNTISIQNLPYQRKHGFCLLQPIL